tara:strand:- start:895 stop:1083 length:189 start_codon:yes stop_codon:yes gene_type:complete
MQGLVFLYQRFLAFLKFVLPPVWVRVSAYIRSFSAPAINNAKRQRVEINDTCAIIAQVFLAK